MTEPNSREIILISGKYHSRITTINRLIEQESSGVIVTPYNVDYVLTELRLDRTQYTALAFPHIMYIDQRLNALLYLYKYSDLRVKLILGGSHMLPRIREYLETSKFPVQISQPNFSDPENRVLARQFMMPAGIDIVETCAAAINKYYNSDVNHLVYLPTISELRELKVVLSKTHFNETFTLAEYNQHLDDKTGLILLTSDEPPSAVSNLGVVVDSGLMAVDGLGADSLIRRRVIPIDSDTRAMHREAILAPGGQYIIMRQESALLDPNLMSVAQNATDISQTLLWLLQAEREIVQNDLYYENSLSMMYPPGLPVLLYAKSKLFGLISDNLSVIRHPYLVFSLLVPRIAWLRVLMNNPAIMHYLLLIMTAVKFSWLTIDNGFCDLSAVIDLFDLMCMEERRVALEYMRDLIKVAVSSAISLNDRRELKTVIDFSDLGSANLLPDYAGRAIIIKKNGSGFRITRTF